MFLKRECPEMDDFGRKKKSGCEGNIHFNVKKQEVIKNI